MQDDLSALAKTYLLGGDYSPGYRRQFLTRITAFSRLAKVNRASEFHAEPVNQFLENMQAAAKWSNHTIRGYRTNILTLWMFAADSGLAPWPPRRIRRIKATLAPVRCWTLEELRLLIKTGAATKGGCDGLRLRDWWPAFIRVGYSSALRCGDLLRLRWSDVDGDGLAVVIQGKVQQAVSVRLPADALAACQRIKLDDRLLPWPISREMLRQRFGQLVEAAGVRPGTIKTLRISAITHAEAESPGSGKRLAGHSTEQITARHYTARAVVLQRPVSPPPL